MSLLPGSRESAGRLRTLVVFRPSLCSVRPFFPSVLKVRTRELRSDNRSLPRSSDHRTVGCRGESERSDTGVTELRVRSRRSPRSSPFRSGWTG